MYTHIYIAIYTITTFSGLRKSDSSRTGPKKISPSNAVAHRLLGCHQHGLLSLQLLRENQWPGEKNRDSL